MWYSPKSLTQTVLLCASVAYGSSAGAQNFNTGPITLDVDTETTDVFRLVAAYQPGEPAPVFKSGTDDTVQLAALQVPAGRPQPSIIVGRIAPGQEASFGIETLLPDTIAAFAFAHDDLETRATLKDSNPDIYQRLVRGGHIDPPQGALVEVIQTEMKRMNCYRSAVDGDWGPGSRRSVPEYFKALGGGATWPDERASIELYRTILLNDDVRCETPVAAAPAPRPKTTATTTRRTPARTTTRTTPRKVTTPKKPAAAQPKRKRRIGGGGTIVR